MRKLTAFASAFLTLSAAALCQEPVSLIDAKTAATAWKFDNGSEFPGATGKLELAAEPFRGKPVLSLKSDFTKGGNYVQAAIALPEIPVETLSFWVNMPPDVKQLPVRLVDGSGQCHQIKLKINEKGGWQQIRVPVVEYFRTMGTPAAPDIASQYEKWGGAKDGKWHQPGKLLVFLSTKVMGPQSTMLIGDVLLHPSTEKRTTVAKVLRLDDALLAGEIDWGFNLGQEFRGAKGGLDLVRDQPEAGKNAMHLHADFTGGGAYVGIRKSLASLNVQAMKAIRLRVRSETCQSYALRLVDGTGQCHQRKNLPFKADGKWQEVVLVPGEIAGGEHWGGANDGQWHDSVKLIELMLNVESNKEKKPDLFITDMRADVVIEAGVKAAAFAERFEADDPLKNRWQSAGAVQTDSPGQGDSKTSLLLKRSLEQIEKDTSAAGPAFDVKPGGWQVQYAWKAKLHSPDNSYHGAVSLEVLDAAGKVLESIPAGIGFGESDWKTASAAVTIPAGAAKARFRIQLNKTYGSFWIDEMSAAPLSTETIEPQVERILLATDAVGNLFLPGDKIGFRVTVEAVTPLPKANQVVRYAVRDYWGAEQLTPGEIPLTAAPRKEGRFVYTAAIDLPPDQLETGKFCELHVEVPQEGEPAREFSGLAVLPHALAKKCEPEQVPFTIRNWDSRIGVYFQLADRLGIRMMGVWGGWAAKEPYKPHCPGIDQLQKLGAKWITGTPASSVERKGFEEYSEESLRAGTTNFLKQYAGSGLAMIALGNEPHGKGQKVLDNVRAYKAIYESVKAFDPKIHVIGTSVEPNEEYFKAGYQYYLDSYDFHIYEHYTNVPRTMQEYRALMKKYNAVKPLHSTELGLNSQGQTRHAVALEMIKKCTVFFAEGGATVSWFTIQYPDPKGKARGQFGDSHCVFDCKYNLYNPRLDAIAYYNLVNAICDKRFVEKALYPNGVQAYLFRNAAGDCLQVVWLDDGRADVLVPLAATQNVELVRLDGSRAKLHSGDGGLTLSLSFEPLMLLYRDAKGGLAKTLGSPAISLATAPAAVAPGGTTTFAIKGAGLKAESLRISCPPLWKVVAKQVGPDRVDCTVHTPAATSAREARIYVQPLAGNDATGELTVPVRVGRGE